MNTEKNIKDKFNLFYYKNRYFLSLLILFLIGIGYSFSEEKIINSGNSFFVGMLLFIIGFFVFFYFKKKTGVKWIESSLFWGIALNILFFWSINYLNIKLNNTNPVQVINCELNGTLLSRMNRGFYFSFKGKTKFIPGFYDFMRKLESENYENDLILTLNFSKGWRDSYIIHSWKVEDR